VSRRRIFEGAFFLLGVSSLCTGLAAGCSGTFRFDDHSIAADGGGAIDATDGRDDATSERPSSCDAPECEFLGQPCGSESCLLHCPHEKTCTGRCQSECTADCEENSICTLTTGGEADLQCEANARCSFIVGRASRIECRVGSDCGARCLGSCTLSCNAGATCALACGENAALAPASGTAGCP
jgi:hypothetical protein